MSSIFRSHSPSLPQRRYVYKANNSVKGNAPVEVGYELSCIGLSCRKPHYGISAAAWNPPLSMRLVPFGENKNSFTAKQVNELLDNEELPFHEELTVNTLDSSYCTPEYVVDTYNQPNLVNIIRIANNRNVWKQLSAEEVAARRAENKTNKGANSVYGVKYNLGEVADWELAADIQEEFGIKLSNGKNALVKIQIWEDMMIRTKRGKNMKDKPFRLVQIQLVDPSTGALLFKRPMWLCVWGKRRMSLKAEQIYWSYHNRYDIEHFFRFGKQKLLLDKFQTPDENTFENWMEVVNLAYWLLFVGRKQASHACRKWQQYDKNYKNRQQYDLEVSPSQVQLQLSDIILSFEQEDFLPKPQKKGKGRQTGQTFVKRKKYPVLKKKKRTKRKKNK